MIARINTTAWSKGATVPQFDFLFLAAFRDAPFAYGSLGFVFLRLGLFSAFLLFIRLIVSNNLSNDLSIFRKSIRFFHFGTRIISFGAIRCLFSLLTSVMINRFWSYPLTKRGCLKWIKKIPLRFHSFMSPLWLTTSFDWCVSYFFCRVWPSASKIGG